MGLESMCTASYSGKTSKGSVQLETDAILFRGDFKLTLPFKAWVFTQPESR